jgi:hypothetical protein
MYGPKSTESIDYIRFGIPFDKLKVTALPNDYVEI